MWCKLVQNRKTSTPVCHDSSFKNKIFFPLKCECNLPTICERDNVLQDAVKHFDGEDVSMAHKHTRVGLGLITEMWAFEYGDGKTVFQILFTKTKKWRII